MVSSAGLILQQIMVFLVPTGVEHNSPYVRDNSGPGIFSIEDIGSVDNGWNYTTNSYGLKILSGT